MIARRLIFVLCLSFALALVWSALAKLEEAK